MSPSCIGRVSGMPWQITSLAEVHRLFGIEVVVERARIGVALDVQLVAVGVDLLGRHAGPQVLAGEAQDLGRHLAGVAHALDDLGRLDPRLVPVDRRRRTRRTGGARCARARCASVRPRPAGHGLRSACGSACTCGRFHTNTDRWPAAAGWGLRQPFASGHPVYERLVPGSRTVPTP